MNEWSAPASWVVCVIVQLGRTGVRPSECFCTTSTDLPDLGVILRQIWYSPQTMNANHLVCILSTLQHLLDLVRMRAV